MTTIRVLTVIATLAISTVAFADTPKAPAAPDKTAKKETISDADAEKFVVFFDKLVAIAVTNKEDCTKMAAGFNAHVDANQALIKEAHAAKSSGKELPASAKEKIEKKTREEFGPALSKKCGTDKTVQASLMRMAPKDMKNDMNKNDMDKKDMDKKDKK